MYRDIPEELKTLIEPIVQDHGLELVDAELVRGRSWQLRVVVDTPEGDGRVPVDTCARVSREVGTQLDADDAIAQAYTLEVSSPGLDRVLARDKDFRAACGQDVKLETRGPIEGRRRFKGRLLRFEGDVVTVESDGREFAIPFGDVSRANVVYRFTRADFSARRDR